MENKEKLNYVELSDEELESVAGGFSEGETLHLKSGRTACSVCGAKNITSFTQLGKDAARLAHVHLPCGHDTYIPERAVTN